MTMVTLQVHAPTCCAAVANPRDAPMIAVREINQASAPKPRLLDPVGQVMFAPDGHMCFNVMRRDRSQFRSRVFQAGTPEEKAAAYDTYLGFCGRYEVNEEERSVLLRLALSTSPNWTGSKQKRFAEVTGTRLQLKTPPISSAEGKPITNTVVWERAK